MKRNKRLLLKTAERIETVPESYDQGEWAMESDTSPCGAVACLAGEIIICSENSVKKGVARLLVTDGVWHEAQKLVGLTNDESYRLFLSVGNWPQPFRGSYCKATTQKGRAKAAAALLRYVADGGKVSL